MCLYGTCPFGNLLTNGRNGGIVQPTLENLRLFKKDSMASSATLGDSLGRENEAIYEELLFLVDQQTELLQPAGCISGLRRPIPGCFRRGGTVAARS